MRLAGVVTSFESELSGLAFDPEAKLWWAVGAPKGDDNQSDESSLVAFTLPGGRDAAVRQIVPFAGAVDPEGVAVLAPGLFAIADEADQTVVILRTHAFGSALVPSMQQTVSVEVRGLSHLAP